MPHTILANVAASVSELKRNPIGTVAAGEGFPVAILNHNEPALVERFEGIEDNALADRRAKEKVVKVKLNDL